MTRDSDDKDDSDARWRGFAPMAATLGRCGGTLRRMKANLNRILGAYYDDENED